MKLLILLFSTFSFTVFAQETHTPQYKCTNIQTKQVKYLLIGNEFPQISSLDWSHEVKIATKEEYLNGMTQSKNTFDFDYHSHYGFETHVNNNGLKLSLHWGILELLDQENNSEVYKCLQQLGVD